MTRNLKNSESGITLVETLISLFIIGILTTSGGVILLQSLRGTKAIEARSADVANMDIAIARIRDDLASTTRRASLDPESTRGALLFEGYNVRFDGRIVAFVRNGWSNPGGRAARGDLQRLEYTFEDGALYRRSWAAVDTTAGTEIAEERLIAGLDEIEVKYGREDLWQPEWIIPASSLDPLPDKVEMVFRFEGGDVLVARFLTGERP